MSQPDNVVMDPMARKVLERLLISAEKHEAGTISRPPALTKSALSEYRELRSLKAKEDFEAVMAYAQTEGAIILRRVRHDPLGLIERIELLDAAKLASILGKVPYAEKIRSAQQILSVYCREYPVLMDVLFSWEKLKKVRGTGPETACNWVMACQVIGYCQAQTALGATETPVRDASARLFKDSKRIESLVVCLDVLLADSLEDEARSESEILQELGLYREPQPVRLAGNILVRRERGVFLLDCPYTALPPTTVQGLGSVPTEVLTIENLTTFHVWARRHHDSNVLCIYTAGMPSPAWRAMYFRLLTELPSSTRVLHWGDVDEGGFRIAAVLSRSAGEAGHILLPWKMRPADVPEPQRRLASARTVEQMVKYANAAGWIDIAHELAEARFIAEQEG